MLLTSSKQSRKRELVAKELGYDVIASALEVPKEQAGALLPRRLCARAAVCTCGTCVLCCDLHNALARTIHLAAWLA